MSRVYLDYLQRLPEELRADKQQLELNLEYLAAQSTIQDKIPHGKEVK